MPDIKNRIIGHGEEPLDGILFNPRNWRIHPLNQQNALKGILDEVGWVQDVIVNKRTGNLVDGHLRCQLAEREGAKTIPVVYVDLSEEEEALILSTLDPVAAMAATDKEKLDDLMASIRTDNEQVQKLMQEIAEKERLEYGKKAIEDAEPQIDKAEELRVKWGVESGQLWKLGEHLIYCGNSTKRDEVGILFGKGRSPLMVTNPPYGVAYHANKKGKKSASIEGDLTQTAIPLSFAVAIEKALDQDARLYLFGGTANWPMYSSLFDHYLRMQPRPMIWVKETFVLHPTHYHSQYETVFFGWKGSGGGKDFWYGDRKESDVWIIKRDANKDRVHPTQKPVEVVEIPIRNSAPVGGEVYDPFLGSGTTLIACERLGRKCRAVEISPGYVAVAIQRWVDATGRTPELVTKPTP